MVGILESIKNRARVQRQRIVLPEGGDERIVRAAAMIAAERLADVILLGNPDQLRGIARLAGVNLSAVSVLDPATDSRAVKYAALYYERRRAKGMTQQEASVIARRPLYRSEEHTSELQSLRH